MAWGEGDHFPIPNLLSLSSHLIFLAVLLP